MQEIYTATGISPKNSENSSKYLSKVNSNGSKGTRGSRKPGELPRAPKKSNPYPVTSAVSSKFEGTPALNLSKERGKVNAFKLEKSPKAPQN